MLMRITSKLNIQEFQSPQTANSTLNAAKVIASEFLSGASGERPPERESRDEILGESRPIELEKVDSEQISEKQDSCDFPESVASSPSNFTRPLVHKHVCVCI